MKISRGKQAGLQAVSDGRGVIAALAIDQRDALRKLLAKAKNVPASEIPGRRRANRRSQVTLCPFQTYDGASGSDVRGIQISAASPPVSPENPRAAAPTIVNDAPLRRKLRPMAFRSRPKRRAQNASLITATG